MDNLPVQPQQGQVPQRVQAPTSTQSSQPSVAQLSPLSPKKTVEARENKNRFLRPAITILTIVLALTVTELGYLLFIKSSRKPIQPSISEILPQSLSPIPPEATPVSRPLALQQSPKAIYTEKLRLFTEIIESLKSKSEFLQDTKISYTLTGRVSDISVENKDIESVIYTYRLDLKSETGESFTYRFTNQEVANADIFFTTTGETNKITFDAIKPDDTVVIISTLDLLVPSFDNQYLIKVLRRD